METILCLETSSLVCSAALVSGGRVVLEKTMSGNNLHASGISPLVSSLLSEVGLKPGDLGAVAISRGPGSFTGLRIGVAFAKGIRYGSEIPLISVDTLQLLAIPAIGSGYDQLVPVINARNGEIYFNRYDGLGRKLAEPAAVFPGPEFFKGFSGIKDRILLAGDGVALLRPFLENELPVDTREEWRPTASLMAVPADEKWKEARFEEPANFEPFYLKDFIARKTSDKIRRVLNN